MKPITYWIPFEISPETESYLLSRDPNDKMHLAAYLLSRAQEEDFDLAPTNIGYTGEVPALADLTIKQMIQISAALLMFALDEIAQENHATAP